MKEQTIQRFLNLIVFLLPWQTILLYRTVLLPEGLTVYGQLGFYLTEILIAVAYTFRGKGQFRPAQAGVLRSAYVFVAAAFVTLGFCHLFIVSLGLLVHVFTAGMLFLLLLDVRTKETDILRWFVFGLIAPSLLGIVQYISGSSPASTLFGLSALQAETPGIAVVATDVFRSLRAYGSFPHPNIFGGYLAMGILALGWLVRHESSKTRVRLYVFPIILLTSALILTFSRGAWLALTVSLTLLLAQAFLRKKLIPHRAIPLITAGLLTIILSVGMLHTHIFARFNPTLYVEAISIEERASQYRTYPSVLMLGPIVGVGPGVYVFALESLAKDMPAWSYQPVHNTGLLMLAEIGVLGVAAFGYFLFEIGRLVWGARKTPEGIISMSFVSCLLILSLFDHYLWSMWPGLALATIGLVFAIKSLP